MKTTVFYGRDKYIYGIVRHAVEDSLTEYKEEREKNERRLYRNMMESNRRQLLNFFYKLSPKGFFKRQRIMAREENGHIVLTVLRGKGLTRYYKAKRNSLKGRLLEHLLGSKEVDVMEFSKSFTEYKDPKTAIEGSIRQLRAELAPLVGIMCVINCGGQVPSSL